MTSRPLDSTNPGSRVGQELGLPAGIEARHEAKVRATVTAWLAPLEADSNKRVEFLNALVTWVDQRASDQALSADEATFLQSAEARAKAAVSAPDFEAFVTRCFESHTLGLERAFGWVGSNLVITTKPDEILARLREFNAQAVSAKDRVERAPARSSDSKASGSAAAADTFVAPTSLKELNDRTTALQKQVGELVPKLQAAMKAAKGENDATVLALRAQLTPIVTELQWLKPYEAALPVVQLGPVDGSPELTQADLQAGGKQIRAWHAELNGKGLEQFKVFLNQAGISLSAFDSFVIHGKIDPSKSPKLFALLNETHTSPADPLGPEVPAYHAKVQISLFMYRVSEARLQQRLQDIAAEESKAKKDGKALSPELTEQRAAAKAQFQAIAAARGAELKVTSAFYTKNTAALRAKAGQSYSRADRAAESAAAKKGALEQLKADPNADAGAVARAEVACKKAEQEAEAAKAQGDRLSGMLAVGYRHNADHLKAEGHAAQADVDYERSADLHLLGASTEIHFRATGLIDQPVEPLARDQQTGEIKRDQDGKVVNADKVIPQIGHALDALDQVSEPGKTSARYQSLAGRVDKADGQAGAAALSQHKFTTDYSPAERAELEALGKVAVTTDEERVARDQKVGAFYQRVADAHLAQLAGLSDDERSRLTVLLIARSYANVSALEHFKAGAKQLDDVAALGKSEKNVALTADEQNLRAELHVERDGQAATVLQDVASLAAADRADAVAKRSTQADTPAVGDPDSALKELNEAKEKRDSAKSFFHEDWREHIGVARSHESLEQDQVHAAEVERAQAAYDLAVKVKAGTATAADSASYRVIAAKAEVTSATAALDDMCDGDSEDMAAARAGGA